MRLLGDFLAGSVCGETWSQVSGGKFDRFASIPSLRHPGSRGLHPASSPPPGQGGSGRAGDRVGGHRSRADQVDRGHPRRPPTLCRPPVDQTPVRPPGDNGFPSDHTTLAATVALLVMGYRKLLGAVLLAASFLVGAARIAAHVHHVQDIVAGVLIAALAVGIATAIWRWARPRLPRRVTEPASA